MQLPGLLLSLNSRKEKEKIHPEKKSYISGNKCFQEVKLSSLKIKIFYIFRRMELSSPKTKRF